MAMRVIWAPERSAWVMTGDPSGPSGRSAATPGTKEESGAADARAEAGIVGVGSAREVRHRVVALEHVVLEPSYRASGLGSRLMKEIVAEARERGVRIVPVCPFAVAWARTHHDAADVFVDA